MSALQQEIRDVMEPLLIEMAEMKAMLLKYVSADVEVKLITVRDAAKLLSCGEETIRRRVKSGQLKCKRIGNQMRINPADLV